VTRQSSGELRREGETACLRQATCSRAAIRRPRLSWGGRRSWGRGGRAPSQACYL